MGKMGLTQEEAREKAREILKKIDFEAVGEAIRRCVDAVVCVCKSIVDIAVELKKSQAKAYKQAKIKRVKIKKSNGKKILK